MSPLILLKTPLALETRRRRTIDNEFRDEEPFAGLKLQVTALEKKYKDAVHRPVGPSIAYDCHGLTFACRRTRIWKPQEIKKILEDDGYVRILKAEVLPGDVALYYKDGDAEHSGIVVELGPYVPKVLSKIGDCQEMIHWANDCPYDVGDIRYYRMTR